MTGKVVNYTHFKKTAARLYAVQALFQMEASQASATDVANEFEMHRIGAEIGKIRYNPADTKMFREILNKVVTEQSKIDKLADNALKDSWPLKRIDPTLRALFRAATAEMLLKNTPAKAVMNEFIEIATVSYTHLTLPTTP